MNLGASQPKRSARSEPFESQECGPYAIRLSMLLLLSALLPGSSPCGRASLRTWKIRYVPTGG